MSEHQETIQLYILRVHLVAFNRTNSLTKMHAISNFKIAQSWWLLDFSIERKLTWQPREIFRSEVRTLLPHWMTYAHIWRKAQIACSSQNFLFWRTKMSPNCVLFMYHLAAGCTTGSSQQHTYQLPGRNSAKLRLPHSHSTYPVRAPSMTHSQIVAA
jgi:hypothetical protein